MPLSLTLSRRTRQVLIVAALAAVSPAARGDMVGDVFVIAMENHNWTQPGSMTSPQQIYGNPAAPYVNSLVTPGNPNAAQVSYAANYTNAGAGEHPSEPNYVWAEAGTNFNDHTDADPTIANGNVFTAPHLTSLMNQAGVPWKNYQEDVQLSTSPTISASGANGPVNAYNGSTQYNYAAKHNPMAFFSDTQTQNVNTFAQLSKDLANNTVGRYNWITPDQYNDAHTALTGGFTYYGAHYTGDSANVAQGDNFLSKMIPQIMASQAYKNNGAIVLWGDESEGGDTAAQTVPEIVISPLARGNGYASNVAMNHSSDIRTMQEIFGLGPALLNNPIPVSEENAYATGYDSVSGSNDLSDLFQPGAIPTSVPEPTTIGLVGAGLMGFLPRRR